MFHSTLPPTRWIPGIVLSLCLAILAGYGAGRAHSAYLFRSQSPITLQNDERSPVAVVRLDGVRDGALRGQTTGTVRLFMQDKEIPADASGAFAMSSPQFLRNEITVPVPDGMQFVASRKGKKYYPVTSSAGENISPANRLYFRTAADAEKAGFDSSQ
ncbi:MAG: hypothetical protein JWM56_131 [Candidatus Peribacteria bacterium]|nr:hypothetical protein [Candidatus Peribacteria bacterium]